MSTITMNITEAKPFFSIPNIVLNKNSGNINDYIKYHEYKIYALMNLYQWIHYNNTFEDFITNILPSNNLQFLKFEIDNIKRYLTDDIRKEMMNKKSHSSIINYIDGNETDPCSRLTIWKYINDNWNYPTDTFQQFMNTPLLKNYKYCSVVGYIRYLLTMENDTLRKNCIERMIIKHSS